MTPIPPSCAIAIAILLSVTVSMAADTTGTFKLRFLENFESNSTSDGSTSEYDGTSKTSSKVNPVSINFVLLIATNEKLIAHKYKIF